MQVAFFCCFRQGVAGMSRDLGRDVPVLEKLYARKLWADFSHPNFQNHLISHRFFCFFGGDVSFCEGFGQLLDKIRVRRNREILRLQLRISTAGRKSLRFRGTLLTGKLDLRTGRLEGILSIFEAFLIHLVSWEKKQNHSHRRCFWGPGAGTRVPLPCLT